MTQQDYMNRIEELNQSLKDAWSSDQKVKALKIVIQVRFTFLLCMGTVAFRGVTCLIPPHPPPEEERFFYLSIVKTISLCVMTSGNS